MTLLPLTDMNAAGFWQHESQRRGSDWNGLMRLRNSLAPLTCEICGAAPCVNPSFCRLCCEVDAKAVQLRRSAKVVRPTPQATVEAVKQAVRARNVRALNEIQTQERLQRCDADARAWLDRWMEKRHSK